jgi:ABC-type glutathione transport system ATPase component
VKSLPALPPTVSVTKEYSAGPKNMGREKNYAGLPDNAGPLLRTEALSVVYSVAPAAGIAAIQDVEFRMDRGEAVGIVGPSGSGKSTLALAVLGALPRNASVSGAIHFSGASMAPIFQEPSQALHPMLSVGRQIYEAVKARRGWNHRRCLEEVDASLDLVGLNARQFHKAWPHQLSGGQKHRALIAQAIAGQPDLIVADEPTASLDADAGAGIISLLNNLQKRLGTALLFITHSEGLLAGFAERVLTMREGRLIA